MNALVDETVEHLQKTQLQHLGQTLAQQIVPRSQLARLRIAFDQTRALLEDTLAAVEQGREDAQLLVLEIKAAAGESCRRRRRPRIADLRGLGVPQGIRHRTAVPRLAGCPGDGPDFRGAAGLCGTCPVRASAARRTRLKWRR